jgi:hypothetical protein
MTAIWSCHRLGFHGAASRPAAAKTLPIRVTKTTYIKINELDNKKMKKRPSRVKDKGSPLNTPHVFHEENFAP